MDRSDILQECYWQKGLKTFPLTNEKPKLGGRPEEWNTDGVCRLNNNSCVGTDGFGVRMSKDIFALDFDSTDALEDFRTRFPNLNTFIVKSPKGYHYYFSNSQWAFGLKRQCGKFGKVDIFTQGKSGYLVGPSSVRDTGEEYTIDNLADPMEATPELIAYVDELIKTKPSSNNEETGFIEEGGRQDKMKDYAHILRNAGRPNPETLKDFLKEINMTMMEHPLPEEEIDQIVDTDYEKWAKLLSRHTRTYITSDEDKATMIGEGLGATGWHVRDNIRSRKRQWRQGADGDWQDATDGLEATVFNKIIKECEPKPTYGIEKKGPYVRPSRGNIVMSGADWNRGVASLSRENEVDPVALWLDDLAKVNHTKTLDNYLSKLFRLSKEHNDDYKAYYDWVFKSMLVGGIKRAMEPGCEIQHIPIFTGPQGIGKTALVRNLMPFSEWYEGDFSFLHPSNKVRIESTLGKWGVEWSELDGLGSSAKAGATLDTIKNYITLTNDSGTRLAYDKHAEVLPRRFFLVGTSNDASALLKDETGQRRFCVVNILSRRCTDMVYEQVRRDMKSLWTEAMHLYRQGFEVNFDHEGPFKKVHMESILANHDSNDLLQGKLQDWFDGLTDRDIASVWKIETICKMISYPQFGDPSNYQMKEVGTELRTCLGFEKKQIKVQGTNANYWFLPVKGSVPKIEGRTVVGKERLPEGVNDVK